MGHNHMKALKMVAVFLVVLLLATVAIACTAGGPGARPGREVKAEGGSYRVVSVADLKSMLENKDFLFVNVHTPYEGEISGTDLFIPYDQLQNNLFKLAERKDARIVVYCQAGVMGTQAAATLVKLGYTNVSNLEGGMLEWKNQGNEITNIHNCIC